MDYLHEPAEKLALVLVRAEPWEVATIFLDEEDLIPSPGPLAAMLRRWHARYGVEPAYIGGRFYMELTTTSRPQDDAELRALAREFLLTCPSDYEAFAHEPASRLLARLRGERWVCWWFVE